MKNRSVILVISLLSLISFAVFTYLTKNRMFISLDFDSTVRIQNHIPRSFDTVFSMFSLIGSFEIITVMLLIILIVERKFVGIIAAFVLFAVAHLAEILGKAFFTHPGPPFMFFRNDIPFFFPTSYIPQQAGIEGSYPSGHSLRIVFLAVIISYLLFKQKKSSKNSKIITILIFTIFTLVMLISRISLGEHWTTDVIGGSLLGLGFGILSLVFL